MTETTEKAILAGDRFWGMQDLLRKRPDVLLARRRSSRSGFESRSDTFAGVRA